MFTQEDWKLFIPALATAIVGMGTILINNLISRRQIDSANKIAQAQRSLTISTTIEKEWRTDLRKYTAGLIYSGTQFSAQKTYDEIVGNTDNEASKLAREMHSNFASLSLLIDDSSSANKEFIEQLERFLYQIGQTQDPNNGKRVSEIKSKIAASIHKVTMPKVSRELN